MATRFVFALFVVGVFALAIALFAPAAIDPIVNDVQQTHNMTEGETVELTDTLDVTLNDVDQGGDGINATYRAPRTQNTTFASVNTSESKTIELDGDNITITNEAIESNTDAIITSLYPPMFGWDSGPRTFIEELDTIMMILFAALAGGLLVFAVKQI